MKDRETFFSSAQRSQIVWAILMRTPYDDADVDKVIFWNSAGFGKIILNFYSCMSLYMQWPLSNFHTFHHLDDSYRNTISEWAVGFRYGNFTLKLACGKKNLASRRPTALGRIRFFALVLIFEDFSTLGMKKFPYLKTGPFGNPIFLYELEVRRPLTNFHTFFKNREIVMH